MRLRSPMTRPSPAAMRVTHRAGSPELGSGWDVLSVVDAGTTVLVWEELLAAVFPRGLSRCYSVQGTGCCPVWVTRYARRSFDDPTRQGRVDCHGSIGAWADRPATEHDRSQRKQFRFRFRFRRDAGAWARYPGRWSWLGWHHPPQQSCARWKAHQPDDSVGRGRRSPRAGPELRRDQLLSAEVRC